MNAIQQFYEMIAEEFSRIEELKAAANERGEYIENVIAAWLRGDISEEDKNNLLTHIGAADV
jgi:hypothetical protein